MYNYFYNNCFAVTFDVAKVPLQLMSATDTQLGIGAHQRGEVAALVAGDGVYAGLTVKPGETNGVDAIAKYGFNGPNTINNYQSYNFDLYTALTLEPVSKTPPVTPETPDTPDEPEEDLPPVKPPLVELPVTPPVEVIPDEEPPLVELPVEEELLEEELPEEEVPMAEAPLVDLPKTGGFAANLLGLVGTLTLGLGLNLRRKDEK